MWSTLRLPGNIIHDENYTGAPDEDEDHPPFPAPHPLKLLGKFSKFSAAMSPRSRLANTTGLCRAVHNLAARVRVVAHALGRLLVRHVFGLLLQFPAVQQHQLSECAVS